MEKNALPFPLREFMIKCWRRHRDVPTRIDQLVDRAVEDLLYRKHAMRDRMTKNKINGKSLVKVENLLLSCFEATRNMPDDSDGDVQKLKEKIKSITEKQATQETKLENTQLRFVALNKKGRLGAAGKPNWEWAHSDIDRRQEVQAETTESQKHEETTLQPGNVEWVECVLCSKWRILPRSVEANTLPDDWNCSAGAAWRTTGLHCDVEPDVDNEDDINGADERSDEDNATVASQSQTREGASSDLQNVAWVECVLCSKWRILPPGVEHATLPDDWHCSAGATWKMTGLTCDVEEDVYIEDDTSAEDE
jgi:hypothetical protein